MAKKRNRGGRISGMTSTSRTRRSSLPTRLRAASVAPATPRTAKAETVKSRRRLSERLPTHRARTRSRRGRGAVASRHIVGHLSKRKRKSLTAVPPYFEEIVISSGNSAATASPLRKSAETPTIISPPAAITTTSNSATVAVSGSDQLHSETAELQTAVTPNPTSPLATMGSVTTSPLPLATPPSPTLQLSSPQQTCEPIGTYVPLTTTTAPMEVQAVPSCSVTASVSPIPSESPLSTWIPPNNPMQLWSTGQVKEFIRTTPLCEHYAKTFEENAIDGEALLLLKFSNLVKSPLNMKVGHAVKLVKHVRQFISATSAFISVPGTLTAELDP